MPIWVWLFLIVLMIYGGVVLFRAWNGHYVRFGPITYSKNEDPAFFWFLVASFIIAELIVIGLFGAAVVSVTWGPIFKQ